MIGLQFEKRNRPRDIGGGISKVIVALCVGWTWTEVLWWESAIETWGFIPMVLTTLAFGYVIDKVKL